MSVRDRMRIALWNLQAGRQMVYKIIFGITFVFMLLLCVLMVARSFAAYTEEFNRKHGADCYYYEEIESQNISDTWLSGLSDYCQSERERYHAREVSVLCTLQPQDGGGQLEAGHTVLSLGDNDYRFTDCYIFNRKPYQNIYGEQAPVELALYQEGMYMFPDKIINLYGGGHLIGDYPRNPGEIILDTYILEAYGIEDAGKDLLGKKVSIYRFDADEALLKDYVLTGILQSDFLSTRESLTARDYHLEHIYVNPRKEDMQHIVVSKGSIRYYFDDYTEYARYYENREQILRLHISQVYSSDYTGARLTEMGIEYCLLYWVMHNVGRLLALVAGGIGMIITFSIFYILEFYRDRNFRYLAMLLDIGMERRDRTWIFSIEMCYMMLVATVLGIYLSVLFLLLLNSLTIQVLDFHMAVDMRMGLLALGIGWVYIWICLWIVMRKR